MAIINLVGKNPAEIAHGWMLIGLGFNLVLLGMITTQVYHYFAMYKKDRLWMKIFVGLLLLAEVANSSLNLGYLYTILIVNFGNTETLAKPNWLFGCGPGTTSIIAMAVQMFFAWRVYVLTHYRFVALVIFCVAATGGVCGLITTVSAVKVKYFVELRKAKTGFQRMNMIIDRIIRLTVQTGMITMIVASFDILFYLADPSGLHLLFNLPLSKLYTISVLSSLNTRRGSGAPTIGGDGPASDGSIITMKGLHALDASGKTRGDHPQTGSAQVFVHVESHEMRETSATDSMTEKTEKSFV